MTMCYFSASSLAARVSGFALLDRPFTINGRQKAYAVLDDVLTVSRSAKNEIIQLTDAERATFVAAVAPVLNEQRRLFGQPLFSAHVS
jgi:hypothetical protein